MKFGLCQVGSKREEKAANCICETAEANALLFNIVTPTIYLLAIARQTFAGFTRRPHLRAFMQKVKAIKASGCAHTILCTLHSFRWQVKFPFSLAFGG